MLSKKTEKGRPGGANIPMMLFTPDSEILLASTLGSHDPLGSLPQTFIF